MKNITRRRFINRSLASVGAVGAAAVARASGPRLSMISVPGAVLGANERIRVGLIGSGDMGRGDLSAFLKYEDVDCPVICDVDDDMLAKGVKVVDDARSKRPDVVKDFRRVIDRKDVDVCLVATPDHWHALPTIYACQASKDVYVEKPLATSIGEGRAMLDAARKHDRVVQMGAQWRSGRHYQEAVAYVQSGKLGKIRLVRCWAYLSWSLPWLRSAGKPVDGPAPPGVDYDMWLGPAPKRPFNPARFHFTFRWFWDYAGGLMTDWGVHLINLALWAMQAGMPQRASASGGKYILDDISETPDTQIAVYDYPGFTMVFEHQMGGGHGSEGRPHGVAFYGTEGTLIIDDAGWKIVPEEGKNLPAARHAKKGNGRPEHVRNLIDCVRSRQRPVEDIEIGHLVSAVAHLGNLALLTRRSIHWDADDEQVIDNPEANLLLTKPYRAPWKLAID